MQLCYIIALTALATPEKSLDREVTGEIHNHTLISSVLTQWQAEVQFSSSGKQNQKYRIFFLPLTHCLIFVIHLPHSPTYKMCIITGKLWGLNDSCLCKALWSSDKNCLRNAKYYHKLELYFSVTIDSFSDGSASTSLTNLALEINFPEYKYPTLYYPNH